MSRAEELLDSLTEEQIATYGINPSEEPHIVIESDKTVTVPDELRHIAVQGEHNIETVTFDCPRYWDSHDLSQMQMRIVYQRPDGHREPHLVENLRVDEVDENTIHFDWTISGNVTAVKGNISFMVCAKLSDSEGNREREWHTRLNQDLVVDEGMECSGEEIVEQNPDIIEAILVQLDDLKNTGGVSDEQIANAVAAYLEENPIEVGVDEEQVRSIVATYLEENPPEGGAITDEQIAVAVADYMSQHPIEGEDGGYYTPSITQPTDNTMQVSFTPSKASMPAMESVTVNLPIGEGSGENVDLTGYATEEWVRDGYQPKGSYLTAIPVASTETLGGVKPTVSKGEGMTQPVAVDKDGGLWTAAGASGTVLVASSDAPDIIKAAAQYVCSGVNDQMTINAAIQAVGKGEVRLSGGNYYLTSEIVLADDITLTGKNAILNVCDEISSTITQAYTGGDTVIHVADTSQFLVGQKVSTDAGIASKYPCRIIEINDDALTVTLDTPLHGTNGFDAGLYRLIADFTVLPCEGLSNVVIDGLVLNCNGGSYGYYDTAFGGNGILFYQANRCTAQNCIVNEAQNHGILTTSSEQCRIINCVVNNCERLGIDTFSSTDSGGHLIHGCTAKGCNVGFQLHNAVNTVVSNCFSIDNATGISAQEHPENVIVTGCVVLECGYAVKCIAAKGKKISIVSNHIYGTNADSIQIDASANAHDWTIADNFIGYSKGNGINIIGVDGFTVTGNTINNVNYANTDAEIIKAAIRISGAASNGMVSGNHITLVSDDTTGCPSGIAEMATFTGNNNVVVNNVIRGARIAATQKVGANSKFENNYEFA